MERIEGHYSNCSDKGPMELKPRNKDLAKLQKLYLIEQKQPYQVLWVLDLIGYLKIYSKIRKTK
jgi:hypothetical protein